MQAAGEITQRVQQDVKRIDPEFMLTSEYPGNDYLSASLDGSLDYESARHVFPAFRPVPLNVMRFYFPEHKFYDLDTSKRAHGEEWRFWNASELVWPALASIRLAIIVFSKKTVTLSMDQM